MQPTTTRTVKPNPDVSLEAWLRRQQHAFSGCEALTTGPPERFLAGTPVRARLDHAFHGVVMRELADVAAAILDDVGFVAVVDGLNRRQGDAGLRPEAGEYDLVPAALLDGGDEVLVVPGVHARAFDRCLLGK
jgi:hypothetical protein